MMGISPLNLDYLLPHLISPVLIIGGGGGLNVEYLRSKGFEVDAIDTNAAMVEKALINRHIEIALCDIEQIPAPDGHYGSILVATGVVNKLTLYLPLIETLITQCQRLLRPQGKLILGFFHEDEQLNYAFEKLKLSASPSHNRFFAPSRSCEEVARRLIRDGGLPEQLVRHVFDVCAPFVESHRALMNDVHRVAQDNACVDVDHLMAYGLAFDYNDLGNMDVDYLMRVLANRFLSAKKISLSTKEVGCIIGVWK